MTNFYSNLDSIWIHDSDLRKITKNDLKEYKNLKVLKLPDNEIKVIEENLFIYTKNLAVVNFENNQIFHIDPQAFSSLTSLTFLYLDYNECSDKLLRVKNNATLMQNTFKLLEEKICYNPTILEFIDENECVTHEIMTFYQSNQQMQKELNEIKLSSEKLMWITISIGVILLLIGISLTCVHILSVKKNVVASSNDKTTKASKKNSITNYTDKMVQLFMKKLTFEFSSLRL